MSCCTQHCFRCFNWQCQSQKQFPQMFCDLTTRSMCQENGAQSSRLGSCHDSDDLCNMLARGGISTQKRTEQCHDRGKTCQCIVASRGKARSQASQPSSDHL